jgi:hypothetical protein
MADLGAAVDAAAGYVVLPVCAIAFLGGIGPGRPLIGQHSTCRAARPTEGALGLGPLGQEPAGLPAQRVAIVPAAPTPHCVMSGCCRRPTSSCTPPPRTGLRRQPDPGGRSPVRRRVGRVAWSTTHPPAPGAGQWDSSAPTPTVRSWRPAGCRTATSECPYRLEWDHTGTAPGRLASVASLTNRARSPHPCCGPTHARRLTPGNPGRTTPKRCADGRSRA